MTADFRSRSRSAIPSTIWPGFVDALTGLLLVLIFTISTFVIVQFLLRGELSGQQIELATAQSRIGELSTRLDEEARQNERLQQDLEAKTQSGESLQRELELETAVRQEREADIEHLLQELEETQVQAQARQDEYETDLDRLAAELQRERDRTEVARETAEERQRLLQEAAEDAQRREALLVTALETERSKAEEALAQLSAREAAIDSLNKSLEEARLQRAELAERLELLDNRLNAESDSLIEREREVSQARQRTAELVKQVELLSDRLDAESKSREEQEQAADQERRKAADLNRQTVELREQILELQGMLRASELRDEESQAVIRNLGQRLNIALAQQVGELSRYRSEFFGRMREALGNREDIRIVGDRFVFASGVLFPSGSTRIGAQGSRDLAVVADALVEISLQIPQGVDWLVRVDGHTDAQPVRSGSRYRDNWDLSQARALSVVRFFVEERNLPPERFAAAGFGEFRPVAEGNSPEAWAQNRRMEITLTNR